MTWAQRLKRVFQIHILTCEHCGGAVKVIAGIEDPVLRLRPNKSLHQMSTACEQDQTFLSSD